MTSQMALDLTYATIMTAAKLSAPILLTAVIVGILVNIIQTVTSIKDMSLTFVPKVVVSGIVMALSLPWGISVMNSFFQEMYTMFAAVAP